ncbi:ABC transporter ATP-binding protein [Noviherbaspirillum suwonense]|uniref:Nucleoside ABC transporter ATP-binding protein n=1 Tax=Noviherbaspirillum suwonense TaxID=1224511 RepID=A0ABY1Q2Q5_9BURK|nr:ABC transporter ATP-binding protein [Noviherbaspirillum suwonense]SMP53405.1 nucleoside ABC transporter ATP-binding protein [Noviherbaspirillum suwonense]
MAALSLATIGAGKSFGSFRALDDVSIKVAAGTVHALLGENGAGKSTLVKGLIGYSPLDQGAILLDGRECAIGSPRDAHALGIGMVYQHFTLAPGLTVAENLLLARGHLPWRISWKKERAALEAFMDTMPFRLALGSMVSGLSAGEKQKLELLKQLYLQRRFLILDEPTSVLTPQEAEEVLGLVRDLAHRDALTVLMITHKFQEVTAFADDVTVLRKGRMAGQARVADTSPDELAAWMMGQGRVVVAGAARKPVATDAPVGLDVQKLCVGSDRGTEAVGGLSLQVRRGEIVGIAGISGNGQKELVEALLGQRKATSGAIVVNGAPYRATRAEMQAQKVFCLPEEPLHNACIAGMSVAENMALRDFDSAALRLPGWRINRAAMRERADKLIAAFNVKPAAPDRPIGTLSGGNVQRAVLARELAESVTVLIAANPVFGLDFAAVADIHARIVAAREQGAAVLLVSEDLDELLELADRIVVMANGAIVHASDAGSSDRATLGRHMAGHAVAGTAAKAGLKEAA